MCDNFISLELIIIMLKCNGLQMQSYIKYLKMPQKYNKWNDYEDQSLTQLMQKCDATSWRLVSNRLKVIYGINRTTKQCRQRWNYHLNRPIQNSIWTQQQDQLLIQQQSTLGSRWREITVFFAGRCQNDVKNHFYSLIRKSLRQMCQYADVKTSEMKIDGIKPVTLSKLFVLSKKNKQLDIEQHPQEFADFLMTISKAEFLEISEIIKTFIINSYNNRKQEKSLTKKQKVLEALQKILLFNSFIVKQKLQNSKDQDLSLSENNQEEIHKLQASCSSTETLIFKKDTRISETGEMISGEQRNIIEKEKIFHQDEQNLSMEDMKSQTSFGPKLFQGIRGNNAESDQGIKLVDIINSRLLKNIELKSGSQIPINEELSNEEKDSSMNEDEMADELMFHNYKFVIDIEQEPFLHHPQMRVISTPAIHRLNSFECFLK